jgi:membrane protease YdiL (CAAX protease family)
VYQPAPEPSYPPASRPVVPLDRLAALVEVVICSGFPSQIVLIVILHGFGLRMTAPDGRMSPPFIFTVSLLDAVLVVSLCVFFMLVHRESPREVLFGNRTTRLEAFLGFAIFPALFVLIGIVRILLIKYVPQLHNVPVNPLESMLRNWHDAAIFCVVVVVSGGVREEVQRGFIVHRFGQYLGGAAAGVLIYSVFFGLGHVEQGYDVMVLTALLGIIWGFLYVLRRSVIASMVSHSAFDLAQLLAYMTFVAR